MEIECQLQTLVGDRRRIQDLLIRSRRRRVDRRAQNDIRPLLVVAGRREIDLAVQESEVSPDFRFLVPLWLEVGVANDEACRQRALAVDAGFENIAKSAEAEERRRSEQ